MRQFKNCPPLVVRDKPNTHIVIDWLSVAYHSAATRGQSWSWSYGSWIYNCLCNQCLSRLTLWGRIPVRLGVLDTTLYDNVCQWLASGGWFSPVFSTNKTDRHETTEILLKVVLSIITLIHPAANNMFHAYIGREKVQVFIKQNIQKWLTNGTTTFVIRHKNGTYRILPGVWWINKGNNKITDLRTIFQRESQNS